MFTISQIIELLKDQFSDASTLDSVQVLTSRVTGGPVVVVTVSNADGELVKHRFVRKYDSWTSSEWTLINTLNTSTAVFSKPTR